MFRDFNRSMLPTAVWCIKLNPYIKYYITIDFSWLIKQFRIYLIAHKHSYVSLRTTPSICKARKAGGSAHKANDKCAPKIHRKCQSKCFPSNCFYYANRIKSHSHAEMSSEYILNDDIYMQLYIYILYVYECVCAFNSRSMLLIANTLKPQVACNNWRRSEAGLAYVRTCVRACMRACVPSTMIKTTKVATVKTQQWSGCQEANALVIYPGSCVWFMRLGLADRDKEPPGKAVNGK